MSLTLFLSGWLALTGAHSAETHGPQSHEMAKKTEPKPATAASTQASQIDAEYKIGPQDLLRIDVWKETEISRNAPVRPDGKISLPLLNDVQAAGLTPMQLAANLTEKLKKYLADPRVTVVVTAAPGVAEGLAAVSVPRSAGVALAAGT